MEEVKYKIDYENCKRYLENANKQLVNAMGYIQNATNELLNELELKPFYADGVSTALCRVGELESLYKNTLAQFKNVEDLIKRLKIN